jgi:hypothetical protein
MPHIAKVLAPLDNLSHGAGRSAVLAHVFEIEEILAQFIFGYLIRQLMVMLSTKI